MMDVSSTATNELEWVKEKRHQGVGRPSYHKISPLIPWVPTLYDEACVGRSPRSIMHEFNQERSSTTKLVV